jgi:hypothetical protein
MIRFESFCIKLYNQYYFSCAVSWSLKGGDEVVDED